MSKRYIMPSMRMAECETEMLLANSDAVSSDLGIKYGGVDEDGEIEADSRRGHSSNWDD